MCSLISVSKLRRAGFTATIDTGDRGEGVCVVTPKGGSEVLIKEHECEGGLQAVELSPANVEEPKALAAISELSDKDMQKLLHLRLRHVSKGKIEKNLLFI